MNDFVPRGDTQLLVWLENLSAKLGDYGKSLGLSATEIAIAQKGCSDLGKSIKNDEQKRKEWLAAVDTTQQLKQTTVAALRTTIARIKVSPSFTAALGKEMGVTRSSSLAAQPAAIDNAKPKIQVDAIAGRIRLKFTRKPFDGINIYTRKQGEGTWRFLARVTQSPYTDPTPLTTANIAEIREYQALGVLKDQEVGQPSNIVVAPLRD